ncbi:hypothetical protein ZWY2020_036236 [Hordeum vulgare]|nr:hypothetical protein ZWY2020_036236 [Hordeum vulgare]
MCKDVESSHVQPSSCNVEEGLNDSDDEEYQDDTVANEQGRGGPCSQSEAPAPRTVLSSVSKRLGSSSRATSAKRVGFHLAASNPHRRSRRLPPSSSLPPRPLPAAAPLRPLHLPLTVAASHICRAPSPAGRRRRTRPPRPAAVQLVLGLQPASAQFSWTTYKLGKIMFKNTFQSGFLSILYSLGTKPLQIWDKEVVDGHIKRPQDEDIKSNVLEIVGTNVQSTYITCPADPAATLGIKLPFLALIVKNLKKYFTFEVHILDDKNVRRRFRASNFQSVTRVKPYICTMPLKLDDGWNNIQLNLTDLTKRAYGTNYAETLRVQVHANCRLRRIYFSDRLYSEEELPAEFKLYLPIQKS